MVSKEIRREYQHQQKTSVGEVSYGEFHPALVTYKELVICQSSLHMFPRPYQRHTLTLSPCLRKQSILGLLLEIISAL